MRKPKKHDFSHHIRYGRTQTAETISSTESAASPASPKKFPIETKAIRSDLKKILFIDIFFIGAMVGLLFLSQKIDLIAKLGKFLKI